MKPTRIKIQPFSDVNPDLIQYLKERLSSQFGWVVRILETQKIPPGSYDRDRGQYLSHSFLRKMEEDRKGEDYNLGVVDEDLFVPRLNFVFGTALPSSKIAVISVTRLKQEFYGGSSDENTYRERVLKEAIHELGHLFGLDHCPDPYCVMHFSNSLQDTDRKTSSFCSICSNKIP